MGAVEPICSPRVLEVLVNKVHQHLGPDFSGTRSGDLLRRLKLLAFELEVADLPGWLEALAFAEWDAAQVQALTPAFTVGETYFRRDAEALDWLAQQHLLPLLAQRRAAGRKVLRLWSAACCTGEEAYSLLFLIDELLGADRADWSLEIVASDINPGFLARAEHGCYGQNAFRRNEEAFRTRHFQAQERLWRVRPQWRGRIRFLQHNLVGDPLPCPAKRLEAFDLILCRHVLMYFSAERAAGALRRLLASLAPGGLLLLSAVEASIATQAGLRGFWAGCNYALGAAGRVRPAEAPVMGVSLPASLQPALALTTGPVIPAEPPATPAFVPVAPEVIRPLAEASSALFPGWPVPTVQPEHLPLWQRVQQAQARGQHGQLRQALLEYLASSGLGLAQKHQICLLLARSWADQHCCEEAEGWLRRALALDPCSAPCYWLLALLAEQSGTEQAALVALQKALYLDPDFILAHFHQARLLQSKGQSAASGKALQLCRALLARQPEGALVPLGDGLSCTQLLRLCEQLQEASTPCANP